MGCMAVERGYHCGVTYSIWLIHRFRLVPTICTIPSAQFAQIHDLANLILVFPVAVSICEKYHKQTYSLTFFSRLTAGFFSSLTFALPLAAPFAFLAKGFSSSLSLSGSALTFFVLLLAEARGFAAAFFFANGFSSSDSESSLSEYFGLAFVRPFVALPLRATGFLAERGVSSSESSESLAGFWTRLFG